MKLYPLQGVPYYPLQTFMLQFALADCIMQVRFGLNVVLES